MRQVACETARYPRFTASRWGERRGSNPRPQEPQSCALPTELRPPSSAIRYNHVFRAYILSLAVYRLTDSHFKPKRPLRGRLGLARLAGQIHKRSLVCSPLRGASGVQSSYGRLSNEGPRRTDSHFKPKRPLRGRLGLARLAGLEPATLGLEGRCSIQMSYRRFGLRRSGDDGRGRGIRTPDPLLPKQVRYQTALCPVISASIYPLRTGERDDTQDPYLGQ